MKNRRMKFAAALAAISFLLLFVVPSFINLDSLRSRLEAALQSYLGRPVRIGAMQFSLLAGGLSAQDVSIADDPAFSAAEFLRAKSLNVGVSLKALLFSRSLHITTLSVVEPRLTLLKSASGKWNFSSLGANPSQDDFSTAFQDSSAPAFVLEHLKISKGTVLLGDIQAGNAGSFLQEINLDLRNVSFSSAMSFLLSARTDHGSRIELKGEAGPINLGDPQQTPFHLAAKVTQANLASVALLDRSSGLAGIVSIQATAVSNGRNLHSEGTGQARKLRLVAAGQPASQPLSFRFVTDYSLARQSGVLGTGQISTGHSSADLSGTYDLRGKTPAVHLKLNASELPLDDVQGVLPALGIQLPAGSVLRGGTVNANLSLDGPVDRLVTNGTAKLADSHLAKFDFGSKLQSIPVLGKMDIGSDLFIVSLNTHFRIAPEATHISSFDSQLSGIGGVSGEGDIDAASRLKFHMAAHVASDGLLRVALNHARLHAVPDDIPFWVEGTASHPIFVPDLVGIAKGTLIASASQAASDLANKAASAGTAKAVSATAAKTAPAGVPKITNFGKTTPLMPATPAGCRTVISSGTQQTPVHETHGRENHGMFGGLVNKVFGHKDKVDKNKDKANSGKAATEVAAKY